MRLGLSAVCVAALVGVCAGQLADKSIVITVGKDLTVFANRWDAGPWPPASPAKQSLDLFVLNGEGCHPSDYPSGSATGAGVSGSAVLVERGNCTFLSKAEMAAAAGFKTIVVMNTVAGMTNKSTGILRNVCDADCKCSF